MTVPTITIKELSDGITNATSPIVKKILKGILNDFMYLAYSVETSYTTGKTVLPLECTIQDVDEAIKVPGLEKKFKDIFVKISETHKSGDLTPQSVFETNDVKMKPVFVFVTPDHLPENF